MHYDYSGGARPGFNYQPGHQVDYDPLFGTTVGYDQDAQGNRSNEALQDGAYVRRDRYRSLGEAAAAQQAVQPNFARAQTDNALGLADRDRQSYALNLQSQAAHGNAPSAAGIMGQQAAGQSLQSSLGASAGARGMASTAAQMQAQGQQGGMQLGAQQQYGNARAGEMNTAIGQYGQGATDMRGGDYTAMGLSQQQADARAAADLANRKLQQQGQMGFEQLGVNEEQNQANNELRAQAAQDKQNQTTDDTQDANAARAMRVFSAGAAAVGGGLAGSDERMKQKAAGTGADMLRQLEQGFQPYSYEYKPGFQENERQQPGEKNIGPMAQNMASNSLTGTAVKQGDDGMLYIDMPKATKLNSAGIGALAAKQREMEEQLALMKGRR